MSKIKAILESVLYIVIIFLMRQVIYYLFSFFIFNNEIDTISLLNGEETLLFIRDTSTIYQLVGWVLGIMIIIASMKLSKQKVFNKIRIKVSSANMLLSCIIGIGAALLTNGLVNSFSEFYAIPINQHIETAYSTGFFLTIILVGIITPIVEEIMFRGIMLDKLLTAGGKWFAIIVQGLIFSISHLNIWQGIYVLPLAMITGYATFKTKSLGTAAVIHIIFNVFNICLYYYNMNEYYIGQLISLVALGAILTYFGMDKLSYNIFSREKKGYTFK